ncbi:hypothetical protein F2P81_010861 [Scophthalmus maximus]|uniref:Uncharacterized protein n=1 Tax=Scophthalmus maximus TaxID=52904 RepID=A0A6A4SWR7_SCOMX|nr:hypothetical protein F2P81_010861 [Scophthalmus maximus]
MRPFADTLSGREEEQILPPSLISGEKTTVHNSAQTSDNQVYIHGYGVISECLCGGDLFSPHQLQGEKSQPSPVEPGFNLFILLPPRPNSRWVEESGRMNECIHHKWDECQQMEHQLRASPYLPTCPTSVGSS